MALDYDTLDLLRQNHPAWRLLRAQHAPLVASFLQRVFVEPNVRNLSQADLVEALEDELFALRERRGAESFPGTAQGYLNDWAETSATFELPMERPLYRPPFTPLITDLALDEGDADVDTAVLYAQVVVDHA